MKNSMLLKICCVGIVLWSQIGGASSSTRYPFRLLICGIARNCAHSLASVRTSAENLGERFEDYAIVIYENDSVDVTPSLLAKWQQENPHVHVCCECLGKSASRTENTLTSRTGRPCRYEQIARARNRMLDLARSHNHPPFDYVVMADLDIPDAWPIHRLCTHLERLDWDVITAFGVDDHGLYYDYFAFREAEWPLGPEFLGDFWFRQRRPARARPRQGQGLIPILSAFGGLALYRAAAFLPFEFSAMVTQDMEAEALSLLSSSSTVARQFALARKEGSDSLLTTYSHWKQPGICCEHVPFFASIRKNGHQRCFLDSEMILYRWGRKEY